jgi:hypothetical protein
LKQVFDFYFIGDLAQSFTSISVLGEVPIFEKRSNEVDIIHVDCDSLDGLDELVAELAVLLDTLVNFFY